MALTLPLNFASSLQGRDTALVPIVKIGDIYISTNSLSYDEKYIYPLLTSNPSLKESIDIEKRNYKISNISITISNYPYEGLRFSERFTGSLINEPVEIYWISPTTTTLDDGDDSALKIYQGQVRRYDHDDKKVRLVVEDKSQATLHRDLPTEILDPDDVAVPSKYKNKPVPFSYGGTVTPCVIKQSPPLGEFGFEAGNIEIYADNSDDTHALHLIVKEGGSFFFAQKVIQAEVDGEGSLLGYQNGTMQWELKPDNNNIIALISVTDDSGNSSNPISNDEIIAREDVGFEKMIVNPLRHKSEHYTSEEDIRLGYYTSIYNKDTQEVSGTLVRDNPVVLAPGGDFEEGFLAWDGTSQLSSLPEQTSQDIYEEVDPLPNINNRAMPGCHIITNITPISGEGNQRISCSATFKLYLAGLGLTDGFAPGIIHLSLGDATTEDISEDSATFTEEYAWDDAQYTYTTTEWTYIGTTGNWSGGDPDVFNTGTTQNIDGTGEKLLIYLVFNYSVLDIGAGKFRIDELSIRNNARLKGVLEQDYYATVAGRLAYSPTIAVGVPEILSDILTKELGHTTSITSTAYTDWGYAFSISSKINSKKLFEQLASASPYIPRFNNMGDFSLDVIKETYAIDDLSDVPNSTILNDEVIDYSFSRTKIEDVFTKLTFKYHYGHDTEEYTQSYTTEVEDSYADYNADYYGFPKTVYDTIDHSESTLIIDDDRGKYFSGVMGSVGNSPERFAKWMLMWSINQHLVMKVKLPLKYMNLEIGDIIRIGVPVSEGGDGVLGGVKPYGIDYTIGATLGSCSQALYPYFMITSTKKTLEHCEITAMQMHDLRFYDSFFFCGDQPMDVCGVCNGDGTSCNECSEIAGLFPHLYGGLENGCNPPTATELEYAISIQSAHGCDQVNDCNNVCGGSAYIDANEGTNDCPDGNCVGGDTENVPCIVGCMDELTYTYNPSAEVHNEGECVPFLSDYWCLAPECNNPPYINCAPEYLINDEHQDFPATGFNDDYDYIIFINGMDGSQSDLDPDIYMPFLNDRIDTGTDLNRIILIYADCYLVEDNPNLYTVQENAILMRADDTYGQELTAYDAKRLMVWTYEHFPPGLNPLSLIYSHEQEGTTYIPGSSGHIRGRTFGNSTSLQGNNSFYWEAAGDIRDTLMFDGFSSIIIHPDTPITMIIIDIWNPYEEDYHFQLEHLPGGNWTHTPAGGGFPAKSRGIFLREDENSFVSFVDSYVDPSALSAHPDSGSQYITTVTIDYGRNPLLMLTEQGSNKVINNGQLPIIFQLNVTYASESLVVGDNSFAGHTGLSMTWRLLRKTCSELGDLNCQGDFNVLDIVILANCVLAHNCPDLECGCAGNLNGDTDDNGDDIYNVLDIVALANCIILNNCSDLS